MKGQNIRPNPLAWCERTSGRRSRSAKGSPAQAPASLTTPVGPASLCQTNRAIMKLNVAEKLAEGRAGRGTLPLEGE